MKIFKMHLILIIIFGIVCIVVGFFLGKYYMNKSLNYIKKTNEELTVKLDMYVAKNSTLLATLDKLRHSKTYTDNKENLLQNKLNKSLAIDEVIQVSSEEIYKNYGKQVQINDFKIIQGIGPKLEKLLNQSEIITWIDLANTPSETLKAFLSNYGNRFTLHDPSTCQNKQN